MYPDDLVGDPEPVEGPDPVESAPPVVDGAGQGWYLGKSGRDLTAERLDPAEPLTESFDVDDSTTRLVVVDGDVYAAGPDEIRQVDGDGRLTAAASSEVLPSVAESTDGVWASADGRTVAVFDDDDAEATTVHFDAEVTSLAIWHGSVVVTTDSGAHVIRDGEDSALEAISSAATIHADGGLLWVVGAENVVAIDRLHDMVEFQLKTIDTNVCVGDCTSDDLAEFLDQQSTTTTTTPPGQRGSTTSTAPPRDLTPPAVDPTVPTTSTTTSVPAPVPDDTRVPTPTAPSTTAAPPVVVQPPVEPSVPVVVPDPVTPPPPVVTAPPPTDPPPPVITVPPPTDPPPPVITVPPPTDPPPTDPPPTDPPPTPIQGLVLDVAPQVGSATATIGVVGSASACPGSSDRFATGRVWAERGDAVVYSQDVVIEWTDRSASPSVTKPTTIPESGMLTVRFAACGLETSRIVRVPSPNPTVSAITVNPERPDQGENFNAGVGYEVPGAWEVVSADWRSGGGCELVGTPEVNATSSLATFKATPTGAVCNVSVVVSFTSPDGDFAAPRQTNDVPVAPTTTTTTEPPVSTPPP